jgi:hypothetical protein
MGPVSGVHTSGREVNMGKRFKSMNMVQILCTYVCKWKNEIY